MHRSQLWNQMAMLAGGRAAEELLFGDPTTGAANDLEKATQIAREMATRFGMTEALGFMRLSDGEQGFLGRQIGRQQTYSDGTARAIDQEVRRLLENSQQEAETVLAAHRDALDAMAAELLERETLDADDIARLFADGPNGNVRDEITARCVSGRALWRSTPPPDGPLRNRVSTGQARHLVVTCRRVRTCRIGGYPSPCTRYEGVTRWQGSDSGGLWGWL
jgi:hypothetical protein